MVTRIKLAPPVPDQDTLCWLPLSALVLGPINPRSTVDYVALEELTASVRRHGVLEPLLVRQTADGAHYDILAGGRRYRAAMSAGLESVPVRIVRPEDDRVALEIALVENLQRQDLTPLDEARAYDYMRAELGMNVAEIAGVMHKTTRTIHDTLGLLTLPADIQAMIERKQISRSQGYGLHRFVSFPGICAALAKMTAAGQITGKELLRELPAPADLQIQGLVRRVSGHTAFETSICRECPFGAYVPTGGGGGYCLKPEHYAELETAARARGQRLLREVGSPTSGAAAPTPRGLSPVDAEDDRVDDEEEALSERIRPGEAAPPDVSQLAALLREAAVELARHARGVVPCQACQRLLLGDEAPLAPYLPAEVKRTLAAPAKVQP